MHLIRGRLMGGEDMASTWTCSHCGGENRAHQKTHCYWCGAARKKK